MTLEIDFETRSDVDLKKRGVWNYMLSPHTAPLMASYKIDGGPTRRWRPGAPCPADIVAHVATGGMISAHNAAFERLLWQKVLTPRYGWPVARTEQFRCTAAVASALGLPRSLDGLGDVLDLVVKKDKAGSALIRRFSLPRRADKEIRLRDTEILALKEGGADEAYLERVRDRWQRRIDAAPLFNAPEDFPSEFEAFHDYCDVDVETEAEADRRMVPLSTYEQAVYTLDQIINDRGIRVDRTSALAALALAEKAKKLLDREMTEATGGYVRKCSEPAKLVAWVETQGVTLTSAAKADILDLLECDDLPPRVRRALELRQEAAKTSVSKLAAMLDRADDAEGRLRHPFIYHKASTGRWQSVGVNVNNMPRPRKAFEKAGLDMASLFGAFRTGEPELLPLLYGEELGRPLHLISDALRGFLWAAPGHDFIQADYTSIEGAVIAWSSGEDWKVQAMHDIAADPSLPDLYRRAAAQIMNLTTGVITKAHPLRQSVGKVSELACLSGDTQVLTDNGVKALRVVSLSDRVWDGIEWVNHCGLIEKGVRPIVDVDGIGLTAEHLVLTGRTWTPAQKLASDRNTLDRALATGSASLPSPAMLSVLPGERTASKSAAPAARPNTSSPDLISAKAPVPGVPSVPARLPRDGVRIITATPTSSPTPNTAGACSTALLLASIAARTQTTEATRITEAAASTSSGATTAEPIWPIWPLSLAGTNPSWSSIGSTSIEGTNPEICGSSVGPSTQATAAKPASCNPRSANSNEPSPIYKPVYDLLKAGPRNRFMVFSDSGALIVHNCGFGGGVSAFHAMAVNYGVDLDALYPSAWSTASEERREKAVKRHEGAVKRGKEKADVLSREAWIACELIKVGWRANNPAIAAGWGAREAAVRDAIRNPGTVTHALKFDYVVKQGFLWCRLPSGRCLAYASPKLKDQVWVKVLLGPDDWSESEVMDRELAEKHALRGTVKIEGKTSPAITALGVDKTGRKMQREHLYGGILAENDTQAVARDLLVNGMFKAEAAGYPIVFHVYDELVAEVPRGFGDLGAFEKLICELPAWAAGLPLTASGWRGKRYRKD